MKSPGASREFGYLRKWVPIAVLIGVVSGVGSIVFYEAIRFVSSVLLGGVTGFFAPHASWRRRSLRSSRLPSLFDPVGDYCWWTLSGILVYGFAPEAEGHGTDAAIDAFHNKKGEIRSQNTFS